MAVNLNLETLTSLDANKLYYLSGTTGQVKEANWWMRFKCFLGISSARQKISNLVDSVRASLLKLTGETNDDTLDSNLNGINRNKLVKGDMITRIANNFCATNGEKIAKRYVTGYVEKLSLQSSFKFCMNYDPSDASQSNLDVKTRSIDANCATVFSDLFKHAFKPIVNGTLPRNGYKPDMGRLRSSLDNKISDVNDLLNQILKKFEFKGGKVDKLFVQQITDSLFNDDGTRKTNISVDDLEPSGKVTAAKLKELEELEGDVEG